MMMPLVMPLVTPLINAVEGAGDDWCWWLLDSGAAVSVLSQSFKGCYKVTGEQEVFDVFFAANGSPVNMSSQVSVSVAFEVGLVSGKTRIQHFKLQCHVGNVSGNIISTTQLVKKGWSNVQSPGEVYLWHEDSGTMISNVVMWEGCPWLKAKKSVKQPAIEDRAVGMDVDSQGDPSTSYRMDVSMLSASVDMSSEEKKKLHVRRGHYPYDPRCLECQQGRGVSRAPRRSVKERSMEVQADFLFLGLEESKFKFIVLRHSFSGLLGVSAVHENIMVTAQNLKQILSEFAIGDGGMIVE